MGPRPNDRKVNRKAEFRKEKTGIRKLRKKTYLTEESSEYQGCQGGRGELGAG